MHPEWQDIAYRQYGVWHWPGRQTRNWTNLLAHRVNERV